ncbi:MAG: hypothetical protein ACRDMZ_09340, partial [Solirubrobacteraceae bacterium]
NEDPSSYGWEAHACDGLCETEPFDAQHYDEPAERGLELDVPATLPGSVGTISVDFQAGDDRGGVAKQSLIFHLANAPTLPRNASDAFAAPESRTMYVRSR